jgi:tryptophan synthase beta subunit
MDQFLTPIYRFPEDSPYKNIVIKREDLSETGSHKFRYLESQMKALKKQGVSQVVLSTTGNVGITASYYGKKLGIKVFCLMSDHSDMGRAAQVEKNGGFLVISSRPKRFAEYVSKKYGIPLLRASREEEALQNYRSLGEELLGQVPDATAVVNFATSGTSSIGLMQAYVGHLLPALMIVHETGHEIVRGEDLADLVKLTNGSFLTITQEEQDLAEKILTEYGLETSYEGVCSFAAGLKMKDHYASIVVLFSGKKWPAATADVGRRAETLEEIDQLWSKFPPFSIPIRRGG